MDPTQNANTEGITSKIIMQLIGFDSTPGLRLPIIITMTLFFFFVHFIFSILATESPVAPSYLFSDYQIKMEICTWRKSPFISLRQLKIKKEWARLGVDPQSLQTRLIAQADLTQCHSLPNNPVLDSETKRLPYFQLLTSSNKFGGNLQNQSLTSNLNLKKGSFLTIDLCPSKQNLDRPFFETAAEQKWPLGIAVSGLWILKHQDDWNWLFQILKNNDIIWINHSRNHPVYADRPIENNYLLSEGRDIQKEIIDNEKILLQFGALPSIFFRFPGLVANSEALEITKSLGLIPLGSNAWLSKSQKPNTGSIILIHGNGNDPRGLELFNKYLNTQRISLPFFSLRSINQTTPIKTPH